MEPDLRVTRRERQATPSDCTNMRLSNPSMRGVKLQENYMFQPKLAREREDQEKGGMARRGEKDANQGWDLRCYETLAKGVEVREHK